MRSALDRIVCVGILLPIAIAIVVVAIVVALPLAFAVAMLASRSLGHPAFRIRQEVP